MEKSRENRGFFHVFHGKQNFVFHFNLVGGTFRKLLENPSRGRPSKTMKKPGENFTFCHVFHPTFIVFSLKFCRGYPRKIVGGYKSVSFFAVFFIENHVFSHKVFVVGTLPKQ